MWLNPCGTPAVITTTSPADTKHLVALVKVAIALGPISSVTAERREHCSELSLGHVGGCRRTVLSKSRDGKKKTHAEKGRSG
jgi:hypothetical protein